MARSKRAAAKTTERARSRATRKGTAAPTAASRLKKPSAAAVERARRKFEQGILSRGEAAPAGRPLPPGATHAIVGKREGGRPLLKRKRFSTH